MKVHRIARGHPQYRGRKVGEHPRLGPLFSDEWATACGRVVPGERIAATKLGSFEAVEATCLACERSRDA